MSKFYTESKISAFLRQLRGSLRLFCCIFLGVLLLLLFGVTSEKIDLEELKKAFADLSLCWDLFLVTAPVVGAAYCFDWIWESLDKSPAKEHPVCETLGFVAGWLLSWGNYLLNMNNIATVSFPVLWFFLGGAVTWIIIKVLDDIIDCARKRGSGTDAGD